VVAGNQVYKPGTDQASMDHLSDQSLGGFQLFHFQAELSAFDALVALLMDLPDLFLPCHRSSGSDLLRIRPEPSREGVSHGVIFRPGMKEILSIPHKRKFSKIHAQARATLESIRSPVEGVPESRRVLDWESVKWFTVFCDTEWFDFGQCPLDGLQLS